jgi:homoserine O-succinyltransferase
MIGPEKKPLRIAILDLNQGMPNQGMRCIREIITQWRTRSNAPVESQEFDVRVKNELPDTSFDIYISSGGPGDPISSRYEDWDIKWNQWLKDMTHWNENPYNEKKKHIFFICHSFQLASRHFNAGILTKRRSTAFGVFPVHMIEPGKAEKVFTGLRDPFYAVDSRDYQLIRPNHDLLKKMGASILCIEKERRHVPYERAVMGIRFNDYMIGTQFHPEADPTGMTQHLQSGEKKDIVITNYGEEKYYDMLDSLNDPDKIMRTHSQILFNFLNLSASAA